MPEILECTLNARVAPSRIVLGHAHDELPDLGQNPTTAASLPRMRPLARHELPVPSQQRVRRNNRRKNCATLLDPVGALAWPVVACRVVGEPQTPLTNLPPKDAILFDQIGERRLLLAIEPTADGQQQESKDSHVDHGRGLYHDHAKMAEIPSILTWDNTPLGGAPGGRCCECHLCTD
jgi:hypothetical protein